MYGYSLDLHLNVLLGLFLVISIMLTILNKRKENKKKNLRLFVNMSLTLYVLVIIKYLLLPIYLSGSSVDPRMWEDVVFTQFKPFFSITQMMNNGNWFRQVIGNILLLVPIPVYLNYYLKQSKIFNHLLTGFVISFVFEGIQYLTNTLSRYPNRVVDIDDIILNVTGVLLGYLIMMIIKKIVNRYKDKLDTLRTFQASGE